MDPTSAEIAPIAEKHGIILLLRFGSVVTRKMVLIGADLKAIEALAQRPLEDYMASATDEVMVERYLERIIGRMIDINYHLVTEAGQPPPRDYFESFTQLARVGVQGYLKKSVLS